MAFQKLLMTLAVLMSVTSVCFSDTPRLYGQPTESWGETISRISDVESPALANQLVTQAHFDLSRALATVIGKNAANFHTWAVWGSFKARTTINREDFPLIEDFMKQVDSDYWVADTYNESSTRASREILTGNKLVLKDIGSVTARFIHWSQANEAASSDIKNFLDTIPQNGKNKTFLREAFLHYWRAKHEPSEALAQNHILYANLLAILSEHILLQPIIEAAMPPNLLAKAVTMKLSFRVGEEVLWVSRDVPPLNKRTRFPRPLDQIQLPELKHFLRTWGHTSNLRGSAAKDWSQLGDRMKFITGLFRTRQQVPELFLFPQ